MLGQVSYSPAQKPAFKAIKLHYHTPYPQTRRENPIEQRLEELRDFCYETGKPYPTTQEELKKYINVSCGTQQDERFNKVTLEIEGKKFPGLVYAGEISSNDIKKKKKIKKEKKEKEQTTATYLNMFYGELVTATVVNDRYIIHTIAPYLH